MRLGWTAALVASGALMACGGGSLPTEPTPGNAPVDVPGTPVDPNAPDDGATGTPVPASPHGLWPLTTGSTWTYRITDPVQGTFRKTVTVQGPERVEGTSTTAVRVHSVQDRSRTTGDVYAEDSFQLELAQGVVVRLREEDFENGTRVRVTTWAPATMKAVAQVPAALPWEQRDVVRETVTAPNGTATTKATTYAWKVVAVGETVVTPAGTFHDAIEVQRDKLDGAGQAKDGKRRTYWLVPGVGKVREEGERTEELSAYDVKAP
ncbi:hypothetical protein JGU66_20895 [Myxococcaceae bacterium JPH2]|nr:hypothetical protein [Myxococcaceae bacterium JPH2]